MSKPRACANGSTVWTQRRAGLENSRATSYGSSSSTSSFDCRRPRPSSGRSRSSSSHSYRSPAEACRTRRITSNPRGGSARGPGLAALAFEPLPRSRELAPDFASTRGRSLNEAPRCQGGLHALRPVDDSADLVCGNNGVLVGTNYVLELLGRLHEAARSLACDGLCQ